MECIRGRWSLEALKCYILFLLNRTVELFKINRFSEVVDLSRKLEVFMGSCDDWKFYLSIK
jgi:hypothetical protein